jgi:hypothetical protein
MLFVHLQALLQKLHTMLYSMKSFKRFYRPPYTAKQNAAPNLVSSCV